MTRSSSIRRRPATRYACWSCPAAGPTELDKGGSTCIGPSSSLQGAKVKYKKAIGYLQDGAKTSFIFVLKPERSSIVETNRSMEELSKLGIRTNSLIINGVLPAEAATDAFFKKKKAEEDRMLAEIKRDFVLSELQYPLQDTEINGVDALESVASYLFDNRNVKVSHAPEAAPAASTAVRSDLDAVRKLLRPANGTRYLFFTGKGGVGKSTVACATSVYLADQGLRTLIVTTDPASHLQEIFEQEVGPVPTPVKGVKNLDVARIDQKVALDEYRKRILDSVKDQPKEVLKSVEEDLNSPCAEEMSAFEKFMSYFELEGYQVVIFDTAPTGHTLRLLELPSDWKGFIDLGTLAKNTSAETRNKYASVIETMRSKDKSTFVFVVYPEYTPIIEAWRASQELKKQVGIETALVGGELHPARGVRSQRVLREPAKAADEVPAGDRPEVQGAAVPGAIARSCAGRSEEPQGPGEEGLLSSSAAVVACARTLSLTSTAVEIGQALIQDLPLSVSE